METIDKWITIASKTDVYTILTRPIIHAEWQIIDAVPYTDSGDKIIKVRCSNCKHIDMFYEEVFKNKTHLGVCICQNCGAKMTLKVN